MNLFDHQTYTSCIIGASGVIYVLAFFLFASGVIRWSLKLLTVSLIVALYYGSMIWGMIPEELLFTLNEPSRISWQSHLSGAVIGVIMAFIYKDKGEKEKIHLGIS
jgi:membrane associated rhomboid family serine protease